MGLLVKRGPGGMSKHTPGPWEYRPMAGDLSNPGYGSISFGSREHGRIGSVTVRPTEANKAEANARLIAAARAARGHERMA